MRHLRLVHSASASRATSVAQDADAADAGGEDSGCDGDAVDPEIRVLLEHVRALTPLPNAVRTRALMRARAALAAASPASMADEARSPRPSWGTLLVAVALASAFGTAAGAFLAHRSNTSDLRIAAVSSPTAAAPSGEARTLQR